MEPNTNISNKHEMETFALEGVSVCYMYIASLIQIVVITLVAINYRYFACEINTIIPIHWHLTTINSECVENYTCFTFENSNIAHHVTEQN